MENKRQRARVQGAWAGPVKSQATAQPATSVKNHLHQMPGQTWRNKDHHLSDRQFVFREPQQVTRRTPEPRMIEEGVYEISLSPTGVSRLRLYPGFVELKEADWILDQLLQDVPWKQRTGIREDITYQQPRLTAWYGELPYIYSRITMEPNPHWLPVLSILKNRIEENTGHTFNSLLCNLYRDEKDSVDWHSDDEPSLGRCPIIASLSFGATRTFEMRKKPPPEENGDYTYVERVKIPLDHGTLLIMEGATQADWQHRVPKEYHSREPRVNLTFRTVYPDSRGIHW
ncbi:alpha-ketoglutarate-dependent dioxygenase alkB homolog 3 isoform X2 [Dasypus novemcinctus]|uniref:alpha-ketoglutarate-dependent dioxygenase alkB homolog 3 isoform X2 n=1 Tax=Dasypus novemcinctus TaxID=9361 RepID=UPI000328AC72|nr:alpha-ketoglutarate-dependent dioxygenase alkB homolog 3 isoform X2 [Dasypus novemcinctus]XP_058161480.1 alpha-ketoglutarate-dependent dioxygenase alkB homolog 3 isoform X2 [Dasypus novemcinctus]XP_058161481.1 alpha-ketoglutarate-dependent dioxygenase alkB homolog 3 isoform X2 [Dasypus novemcinctus]